VEFPKYKNLPGESNSQSTKICLVSGIPKVQKYTWRAEIPKVPVQKFAWRVELPKYKICPAARIPNVQKFTWRVEFPK
jgi:hypothetical protein